MPAEAAPWLIAALFSAIAALFGLLVWLVKSTITDYRDALARQEARTNALVDSFGRTLDSVLTAITAIAEAAREATRRSEEAHNDILGELRQRRSG